MSQRLPPLKPKDVIKALQRAGFFVHHTSGSHYILKHPDKPTLRVSVAYHNKDLKRRTQESIIEQAGLTAEEFLQFL
ncbi:MAG: addiction module toxin, HicA family [Nitrospira sp.]|nr:addiction module toxin, HicA family [Nitrospira sp.]